MSATSVVVGIDVAKAHVDVSVLSAQLEAQRFDNEGEAHSVLAATLKPLEVALVSISISIEPLRSGIWLDMGRRRQCERYRMPSCGELHPLPHTPSSRERQLVPTRRRAALEPHDWRCIASSLHLPGGAVSEGAI